VVYSIRLTPEQTGETQRIADAAEYRRLGWCAAGYCKGWQPSGRGRWAQTVEALSRDVARLRRQLTERLAK